MTITGHQIRQARELLGLKRGVLARKVSYIAGLDTLRAEQAENEFVLRPEQTTAIRHALEAAGVIFIETNGKGPGVRLRKAEI